MLPVATEAIPTSLYMTSRMQNVSFTANRFAVSFVEMRSNDSYRCRQLIVAHFLRLFSLLVLLSLSLLVSSIIVVLLRM